MVICWNNRNCLMVIKCYILRVEMINLVLKKECLFLYMFLFIVLDFCIIYDDWFGECCLSWIVIIIIECSIINKDFCCVL